MSLCLSKGIGAPIGSILVGSEKFIYKALRFRKIFGGSLRQGGLIVAAAEFAFDTHFPLLKEAHELAQKLALGLSELGVKITTPVQTSTLSRIAQIRELIILQIWCSTSQSQTRSQHLADCSLAVQPWASHMQTFRSTLHNYPIRSASTLHSASFCTIRLLQRL